ncbi:fimbria/pilus outer membrane usher protein [Erwinia tasmaniensis]|uniref:Outer membrane usher protein n=1 Tax=Erwinia tasmaniensis (strain DSM 17950 / CFBP 7177 / CIP 109463 / NCPPB 4357 / Et1/99) TaxID=465817 RepID=B2VH37_ERWT9|nr:fimbria/pilus outer membrane usher protein [Erwinia tasmaniensis]CAO95699.1 Outer membrane usher protein [Erwinia tasmaniensis Et1/99]
MIVAITRPPADDRKRHISSLSPIVAAILLSLNSTLVLAEETFNTAFIHGDASAVNALTSVDNILPGSYPFDIFLNGQQVDHRSVEFRKVAADKPVQLCLSSEQYREYGIRLDAAQDEKTDCVDLASQITGAQVTYDAGIQKVDISVPQIFLIPMAQGSIPTRVYDDGINAGFINYNFSATRNRNHAGGLNGASNYYYLSTNSGVNLGRWRLRNDASWQKQPNGGNRWKPFASWLETDIAPLRSRLQVGQRSTSNQVFDSFQFRGVQLASIPEMLPDSLRGYAPVVHGVARTNARIEVRQNGYTVYSTNVAPGPFALSDIYPSTSSGNLVVTVFEADGSKQSFSVPFSSVPNMLREGIWDYSLTAGKYQNGSSSWQPRFIQGTLSHGMKYDITPYGGVLLADHYRSAVLGMGKSLGNFGAVSFDSAWSDTDLSNGDNKQGNSFRLLYAKSLNEMGTEFRIAGYRYSTSGYYDFNDMVSERANYENGRYRNEYHDNADGGDGIPDWANPQHKYYYTGRYNNKRQRVDMTISQNIGPVSLYTTLSNQSYWGSEQRERTLQAGVNGMVGKISYGVFLQDSRSNYGDKDRSIALNLSMPFSAFGGNQLNTNLNLSHSRQSGDSVSSGVSGTLLDDNRLNYGLQTGHSRAGGETSSLNSGYMGSMGNIDMGYAWSGNYQQSSLNLAGGALAHSGGITLSQPLQNTIVLVQAKNAQGVRLENQAGVAINRAGYAVMNSAMPYRHNRVALRTEDIGAGLDIPMAVKDIVPTQGAISRVTFETRSGQSLLIHLQSAEGNLPTIGAAVFNADGGNVGTVGTNGSTYVSGISSNERLQVKWGEGAAQRCWITLPTIQASTKAGYQELSLTCRPK